MLRVLMFAITVVAGVVGQAADLVVNEDRQTGTRDCAGSAITVNSNRNTLELRGCARIIVNGNSNEIEAVAASAISVLGNDNRVDWTAGADGRAPTVSNLGSRNQVKAGAAGTTDLGAAISHAAGGVGDAADLLKSLGAVEKEDRIEVNLGGDVLFDFNSSEILPAAAERLGQVAALIGQRAVGQVLVIGHTDSVGDDAANLGLSRQRAGAVTAWRAQNGVQAARLQAEGLGESMPVAPNSHPDGSDNPNGRARNRRVEILLATREGVDLRAGAGAAPAGGLAIRDTHACAAGRTCRSDCPDGHCTMNCPAGAICFYDCAGGNCEMQCSAGAQCTFNCGGGNCRQSCATGARCQTSCSGGDCSS